MRGEGDTRGPSAGGRGIDEVARYYDSKTSRLLDKYGPGPRVHYHTGLSDGSLPPDPSTAGLGALMREAQERTLDLLAPPLAGLRRPGGGPARILDVGCGLGGTSLYLAERLGARLTGITVAAEHVPVAAAFAASLGLSDRVEFRVQDAHGAPGASAFDAAIAIESACYLDRFAWLRRVGELLRPGGELVILDWMLGSAGARAVRVDAHWRTRMGPPEEYRQAAAAAGLEILEEECLNGSTVGFWVLARAWNEAALRERRVGAAEAERLGRSSEELANLEEAFRSGSLLCVRMRARRPASSP